MAPPIKVDKEIEDIRRTIAQMSKVLYKFYRNMENMSGRVDAPLNAFDSMMRGARKDVAKIRDDFNQIIVQFPSFLFYVAIFIVVEIMIIAILLFLVYKILETIQQMMRPTRRKRTKADMFNKNEEMISINIPQTNVPKIIHSSPHQFRRTLPPNIEKSQKMERQMELKRPLLELG